MSTFYLFRHGQATLGLESYDKLSDLGRLQAERLGKDLCRRGIDFDVVYTGTLRRQRETAEIVARAYENDGKPFPEAIVEPNFDELDFYQLMHEISPRMQEEDPAFEDLVVQTARAFQDEAPDKYRLFGKYYMSVFYTWVEERYPGLEVMSWEAFCNNVLSTLDVMKEVEEGRKVAAFTSGTPMGLLVQKALGLSFEKMVEVVMALYNANMTTLLVSGESLLLESLNVTTHLAEEERTRY